jgi:hypothetical protein
VLASPLAGGILAAVAVPLLAWAGQPTGHPIVTSAMTTPLVRRISADAIIRACAAAGLCSTDPKKSADHLGFGSTMTRDALDKGSQVVVYLPYGGTRRSPVGSSLVDGSGSPVAALRQLLQVQVGVDLPVQADVIGEPGDRLGLLTLEGHRPLLQLEELPGDESVTLLVPLDLALEGLLLVGELAALHVQLPERDSGTDDHHDESDPGADVVRQAMPLGSCREIPSTTPTTRAARMIMAAERLLTAREAIVCVGGPLVVRQRRGEWIN